MLPLRLLYPIPFILPRLDNEKLKMQLKKKDDDLMNSRAAIDRFTNAVSVNSNSCNGVEFKKNNKFLF